MKFQTKYNIADYAGKKIFHVTPIEVSYERAKDGSIQWVFRCDCGKEFLAAPYRAISGHKQSCGCMQYKNIVRKDRKKGNRSRCNPEQFVGMKNNKLTVIGCTDQQEKGRVKLHCRCDCGNEVDVLPYQFTKGKVQSCGCRRKNMWNGHRDIPWMEKHGLSRTKAYHEWLAIKQRCYNPKAHNYERYGGRGIYMCDEWKDSVEKFAEWVESAGGFRDGLSIDRIDNNGPYAPWNCRFATLKEQQRNQRTNHIIEYNGESHCIAEWAEILGMNYGTLSNRLSKGWSAERALTTPINEKCRNGRTKKS